MSLDVPGAEGENRRMEYRKLPPQDPDVWKDRQRVLKEVAALRAQILARRGGKPFDACEIDEVLYEVRAGE